MYIQVQVQVRTYRYRHLYLHAACCTLHGGAIGPSLSTYFPLIRKAMEERFARPIASASTSIVVLGGINFDPPGP